MESAVWEEKGLEKEGGELAHDEPLLSKEGLLKEDTDALAVMDTVVVLLVRMVSVGTTERVDWREVEGGLDRVVEGEEDWEGDMEVEEV